MTPHDLVRRGVALIRAHQAPAGAFPACPDFAPYRYCWLRDGAFIADAMSRAGERESADAFFDWCARVIEPRGDDELRARYTLDGGDSDEEWPAFQLDGYGLWLWALARHAERHGTRRGREAAVDATVAFLHRRWRDPCFDWWEEREGVHPATLGCIWMGLDAVGDRLAGEVRAAVAATDPRLDASLLVLVPPYGPCEGGLVLDRVTGSLVSRGGGVHRHGDDTYYGGGEWVLLTAMLGSAEAARGDLDAARERLAWVAAHASPDGSLPEQVDAHLLHPEARAEWVERWGPPATPLLWSHAMAIGLALDVAG